MVLHASYKSSLLGMHFKTLCLFEEKIEDTYINLFIYLGKKQQSGVSTHMICGWPRFDPCNELFGWHFFNKNIFNANMSLLSAS